MTEPEKKMFNSWYLELVKTGATPLVIIAKTPDGQVQVLSGVLIGPNNQQVDTAEFIQEIGRDMIAQSVKAELVKVNQNRPD